MFQSRLILNTFEHVQFTRSVHISSAICLLIVVQISHVQKSDDFRNRTVRMLKHYFKLCTVRVTVIAVLCYI